MIWAVVRVPISRGLGECFARLDLCARGVCGLASAFSFCAARRRGLFVRRSRRLPAQWGAIYPAIGGLITEQCQCGRVFRSMTPQAPPRGQGARLKQGARNECFPGYPGQLLTKMRISVPFPVSFCGIFASCGRTFLFDQRLSAAQGSLVGLLGATLSDFPKLDRSAEGPAAAASDIA